MGIDNTDPDVIEGDFAVPTVFNGNFDCQLSNTPGGTIQESLEEAGVTPSLTASLLAELILSTIQIPNTTVGHNRFVEDSTVSINAPPINISQVGLDKNSIGQGSHLYSGSLQSSLGEINSVKSTLHDDNIIHIGSVKDSSKSNGFREGSSAQISINENSIVKDTSKYSINQISSSEVDFFKFSPTEIDISTISSTQVSTSEISPTEISLGEINPTQVSSSEINFTFEIGVGKISSTQIDIPQITARNLDFIEISLTSSILFDQFFSIHETTPYTNSLNNTATNIWSNLLQPPTQLNIDFQITDLPRQLAEATITGFDENGYNSYHLCVYTVEPISASFL